MMPKGLISLWIIGQVIIIAFRMSHDQEKSNQCNIYENWYRLNASINYFIEIIQDGLR